MPVYDYKCVSGHTTEARRGMAITTIPCPVCGLDAERESVYCFAVASSGLPTQGGVHSDERKSRQRYKDYREASHEIDYAYKQREKDVGHEIEAPSYYQIGKARAAQLKKAGVKDLDEVKRP